MIYYYRISTGSVGNFLIELLEIVLIVNVDRIAVSGDAGRLGHGLKTHP